ncbi:MAG: rod shape-determining protein MreD [Solirubrobacteraceae bacterium]
MSGQLAARLSALALVGVVLQVAALSQIRVFGVPADIAPLLVAAVGLLLGSIAGATFGFAVGLLVDITLLQTLGVSSLLLVTVGYGAGRLRELRDPAHGLVPMAVGAGAAAVFTFGFAVLQFLLGVDVPMSILLLRDMLLAVVLGALLALPVHAVARRALSPFVPDDPRRRRRRAYTTGGLSPLGRA